MANGLGGKTDALDTALVVGLIDEKYATQKTLRLGLAINHLPSNRLIPNSLRFSTFFT